MKSEQINPFIQATVETFETMCESKPCRDGELSIRTGVIKTYDLLGVIGLSGQSRGSVMLSMPVPVGLKVVSSFTCEETTTIDADFLDAYGEILNIIAGSATAKLEGLNINLSLPTVLVGSDQQVNSKADTPVVVIPMRFSEWGKFHIEVSMEVS